MSEYILGLDLGTSSVKLVLTDVSGRVVCSAYESYPIIGKNEGRYEQDPNDWKRAIISAIYSISADYDCSRISAIGLSGQMPSIVLIDKSSGEVKGNSILWCDPRADEIAAALLEKWGSERYYQKTGIVLDGRYLVPMYLWLRAGGLAGDHYILSAKDYICYWLSGKLVTDPSTASGYAVYSLQTSGWDEELCAAAGIGLDSLPAIMESCDIIGDVSAEIADRFGFKPDTKIACGGADSVCGALGLGATEPGTICQMWGTSTAIIGVTEKPDLRCVKKYFITPMAVPKTYGMEADLISTGVAFKWLQSIIGADMIENAKEVQAGSEGLLFYPYISGGEQGVLWDPDLKAGLLGLSAKHDFSHISHALMEGMCFEVKRCTEAFEMKPREILCTGFASHDVYFMQMLADVLGMECISVSDPHGSALGAAFLAGIAIGLWGLKDIPELAGNIKTIYKPDRGRHSEYKGIYRSYIANTEKMKQV